MSIIKLHDKYFKTYISEEKLNEAVEVLVNRITADCKDETPLFIGILNGSFMFVADFIRKYHHDCEVSFVKLASYEGTNSTGKIKQLVGVNENLYFPWTQICCHHMNGGDAGSSCCSSSPFTHFGFS